MRFEVLERWDVKYFAHRLTSPYPIVSLSAYIQEHSERVNLHEFPEQTFRILGVNNTGGIFHAYDTSGQQINQPYKRVDAGDFAYNPYRVNVGSIGLVPEELGGHYISPAYVVFAVDRENLVPEYLYLVLKSDWFNPILRAATAGSVRQNLTYDLLETLEIPLPPLDEQRAIVARWQAAQAEVEKIITEADEIENQISDLVYEALGTQPPKPNAKTPRHMILQWSEIDRWSFNYISRARQGLLGYTHSRYPIVSLNECLLNTMNGYCIKPVSKPTSYRMLKLNALAPAGLDISAVKYIDVTPEIADRFSVRQGDLFICRSVGSYDHVAKCAVAENDVPGLLFPDIMIRVRFNDNMLPEYVREVIQTPLGRSFFQSQARTAVGMWKIGAADIRAFPLPLPPLDIQRAIVARVQARRAETARLREQAAQRARESAAEIEARLTGKRS